MKKVISITFVMLLLAFTVRSQERPGLLDSGEQSITFSTGINYAILPLEFEYRKAISLNEERPPMIVGAALALPAYGFDLKDHRIDAFIEKGFANTEKFQVRVKLGPTWIHTEMKTQTIGSLGATAMLTPCYVGEKWNLGLDLQYTKIISSHIKHSELFKEVVFSDVQDGWYKSTASNINLGLSATKRIKRTDLFAKCGISRTGQFNAFLFVPSVYLRIGGTYRF